MKNRFWLALLMLVPFYGITATYYVNDNSLTGDIYTTAIGNNVNAGTVNAPFATLAFALSVATANDLIYVDAGTYTDMNLSIGTSKSGITIRGAHISGTIFNGISGTGIYNFMAITGTNVHIENMTIQNYKNAGAIDITASSSLDSTRVYFSLCNFYKNETYVSFDSNPQGGAVWIGVAGANVPAAVYMSECQLEDNLAEQSTGAGAVFVGGRSTLMADKCRFTCNNSREILTTTQGGAIYFSASNGAITNSYFSGNLAIDNKGGAIMINNSTATSCSVYIGSTIFTANRSQRGAAVFADGKINLTVVNSLFYENLITGGFGNGGTIATDADGSSRNPTVIISNSTVTDNHFHTTFTSTSDGAGLADESSATWNVFNTIIWNNRASAGFHNVQSANVVATYCLIEPLGDLHTGTTGNITSNPLFTGAPDYTLQGTSPAINAGTSTGAPATDLSGVNRSGNPDMGCFEGGSTNPVTSSSCILFLNCTTPSVSSTTPASSVCSGNVFSTSLASSPVGAAYIWTSPQVAGVSGHASSGVGNISETLINSTTAVQQVVYTITPYNGSCYGSAVSYSVNVVPTPSLSTVASQTVCGGNAISAVNFSGTPAGSAFSWTNNNTGTGLSANGSGNISSFTSSNVSTQQISVVTVTPSLSGCTGTTQTFTLTVNPKPDVSAGSNQVITCASNTVSVSATSLTGGLTYSWSAGVSPANASSGAVTAAGVYTVTVTNPANTCTNSTSVSVSSNTVAPNISAGSAQTITCSASTVTVSGSSSTGGVTYLWSSGVTPSNAASGAVSSAGVYTLTVTNPANACTASTTVSVSSNTVLPNVSAGSAQVITCAATTATLSGSSSTSGVNYNWSAGVSPSNTATGTVSTAGMYTLTVTNPVNGCSAAATVSVSTNTAVPNVSAGASPTITCTNTSANVSASSSTSGVNYFWSAGVSPNNASSGTVSASGIYTVTVTDPLNGCTANTTVSVATNTAVPNLSVGAAQVIDCANASVTVSGNSSTSGVTFSWSSGVTPSNTSNGLVSAAGIYTLTVTDPANGCTNSAMVSVTTNTVLPDVNAGLAQTLTCSATSVTLSGSSATGGVTFSWEGPAAGTAAGTTPNAASTNVNTAGVYTLTVTNAANACTATSTVVVSADANLPNVSAGAAQVITCTSTTATLNGASSTSGVSYNWSAGVSPSNAVTGTVTAAGVYTLTVTDTNNGCSSSATVVVTADTSAPDVSASTGAVLTCANLTSGVSGNSSVSNATYNWSTGVVPGNLASGTVSAAGNYTLTVTNPFNGCTHDTVLTVLSNTISPVASVANNSLTISCGDSTATLIGTSSSGGAVFNWEGPIAGTPAGTNPNNDTTVVNSAGTYTLTVTDTSNGCTSAATVQVNMNGALPNVNAGNNQTITCTTTLVTLSGSSSTSGVSFSWEGPLAGTPAGTNPNASNTDVNTNGTYTLTVTDNNNGCTSTATVLVLMDTLSPVANAGTAQTISCLNSSVNVSASSSVSGALFQWSTGVVPGNTASGTVSTAGVYTVIVTDPSNGCVSNNVTVAVGIDTVAPSITANASANAILDCNNTTVSVAATVSSGNTVNWSGPSGVLTGNPVAVNAAGTYTATVLNPLNGCSNTTTVVITANTTAPDLTAASSSDSLNCAVPSVNLAASSSTNGVVYSWTGPNGFSSAAQNVSGVNNAGQYIVVVTDTSNGCGTVDTLNIIQGVNPQAGFTMSPNGGQAPLTVNFTNTSTSGFGSYLWDMGIGNTSVQTNATETYTAPGTYTVVLIGYGTSSLCNDTVMQVLMVDDQVSISIPNVFSPNGDGINDFFFITSSGIKELQIDIYNRWGQVVKQLYGVNATWDGKNVNAEPASDGTYYYIINALTDDNESIRREGYLLLTR